MKGHFCIKGNSDISGTMKSEEEGDLKKRFGEFPYHHSLPFGISRSNTYNHQLPGGSGSPWHCGCSG
jgi:hypothetical protein